MKNLGRHMCFMSIMNHFFHPSCIRKNSSALLNCSIEQPPLTKCRTRCTTDPIQSGSFGILLFYYLSLESHDVIRLYQLNLVYIIPKFCPLKKTPSIHLSISCTNFLVYLSANNVEVLKSRKKKPGARHDINGQKERQKNDSLQFCFLECFQH